MQTVIIIDHDERILIECITVLSDDMRFTYQCFIKRPNQSINFIKYNAVSLAVIAMDNDEVDGLVLAEDLIIQNPAIKLIAVISGEINTEIQQRLGTNLVGILDRIAPSKQIAKQFRDIIDSLNIDEIRITYKTIGGFDMKINDIAVPFNCKKAKELLALLVFKRGAFIEMSEAISYLWPDKDIDRSKRLYRDAVYRLRHTLNNVGVEDCVVFQRARLRLNYNNSQCDYWDFLDGKKIIQEGLFMPSYDWGAEVQALIDIATENGTGVKYYGR